jgi:hypothetical protein
VVHQQGDNRAQEGAAVPPGYEAVQAARLDVGVDVGMKLQNTDTNRLNTATDEERRPRPSTSWPNTR